jgi:hypothetical protein
VKFGIPLLALLFFTASGAQAYIPPAQFIVKEIASKHAGIKGIRIKSLVTALEAEHPTDVHFKVTTLYSAAAETLRSFAYDDSGILLYSVERKPVSAALTPAVLLEPHAQALAESLKRANVFIAEETVAPVVPNASPTPGALAAIPPGEELKRWNGTIAWVIGKKDGRQLWVEKDTFLPIRLVSGELSVDFYKYYFYREFPVPRMMDVAQGKTTILQDEVSEVAVNPDLKEFREPVSSGFTAAGDSAPGAVKELLKKYYELLR